MIFNEIGYYALFLGPTVLAFHLGPRTWRAWIIAAGGLAFFLYFAWIHFGGAWGAAAVGIFLWELAVSRLYRPGSRWCLLGVGQAVLFLAAFKYLTFLRGTWNDAAALTAWFPPLAGTAALFLPLGISFFTFEFIHYATDVYRGRIRGYRLGHYAAFIFFFPTMVAGPIKRYREFVPQLGRARFDLGLGAAGIARIGIGLFKKHALADTFGLWSDRLNSPALQEASPLAVIGWLLAYGGKIYFDFSGYSDIAIGSGKLFGLAIPENFNWPYLSVNISEFWRRWHVSLGRWIFDYVYAPLGGSRYGEWRTAANLVATFAISGLWHGAAYNFILWGLWHGMLMVGHRRWRAIAGPRGWEVPGPVAVAITFVSVNAGWGLFCMDWPTFLLACRRIGGLP